MLCRTSFWGAGFESGGKEALVLGCRAFCRGFCRMGRNLEL